MRQEPQPDERKGFMSAGSGPAESSLERKFWVALVLYGVLAALSWFTLGEGKILVAGKAVELRLLPLVILGGFALRTVLARQAEKIRRGGDKGSTSSL